jgi:hypothetical protein
MSETLIDADESTATSWNRPSDSVGRVGRTAERAVQIAAFQADDHVVPLPVITGEGAVRRRTRRLLAETEIPLRDLHLLDHVVIEQRCKHVLV